VTSILLFRGKLGEAFLPKIKGFAALLAPEETMPDKVT
jgi:hypothetical protein